MSWDLEENEARELIERYLANELSPPGDPWVVHEMVEHDWGWVVYWSTRSFHEGREASNHVEAKGPYLVDRQSGRVGRAGWNMDLDEYIALWRTGGWPDIPLPT